MSRTEKLISLATQIAELRELRSGFEAQAEHRRQQALEAEAEARGAEAAALQAASDIEALQVQLLGMLS